MGLSHGALGELYVYDHRQDTMYARNQWYRWDGTVWNAVDDSTILREMWQMLAEKQSIGEVNATKGNLEGMYAYVQSFLYVKDDAVDCIPDVVSLGNGCYNLGIGMLMKHSANYRLTTKLTFDFDKDARCPVFEHYLRTTFVKPDKLYEADDELIAFVQEALGYSLTADISHHASFWCVGEGANGKGVLFHVLEKLLGPAAVPIDFGALRYDRYQLALLAGKRVALCAEADSYDSIVKDATYKQLVSGDSMRVRQIYEKPFILYPTAKLWWSMNRIPDVRDPSGGFWRRIRIIPFNRIFDEDDRIIDLKEQLDQELPGIFNWALTGWERLQETRRFTLPAQVESVTNDVREESNELATFISEKCYLDDSTSIQSSAFYLAYSKWCKDMGYTARNARQLKREMRALGYEAVRKTPGVLYLGLNLQVSP
jgi:putative DNA primase/helicase